MKTRGTLLMIALFLLLAVSTTAFLWQKILLEESEQVTILHARVQAEQNLLAALEYGQGLVQAGAPPGEPVRIELPGGSAQIRIDSEEGKRILRVVVQTRRKHAVLTSSAQRFLERRP
jgi:hypothetical protein